MRKSAEWYDEKQFGVGARFLREVINALERVEANPLHYEVRYFRQFRFARVTDFPFLIVFKIKAKSIIVHAVFHTSRNPRRFI
jgi:hypothetical protein